MKRGDVVTVALPSTDGHETFGTRPAVVLEALNPDLTIIAPFTTNLSALRFPFTHRVDPTTRNGLDRPSILMLYQLRAIDNRRLGSQIGTLNRDWRSALDNDLMAMFSL